MSSIVLAGFDSFRAAESAVHALLADGFREDAITVFRVRESGMGSARDVAPWPRRMAYLALLETSVFAVLGATVGAAIAVLIDAPDPLGIGAAAIGALAGSLAGALLAAFRSGRAMREQGTPSPVALIAVLAEGDEETQSALLLRDAGGTGLERLRRRSLGNRWASFDSMRSGSMHPGI